MLRSCVAKIAAVRFQPDLVFVAGDLLDRVRSARDSRILAAARDYLRSLPAGCGRFLSPGEEESPLAGSLRAELGRDVIEVLSNGNLLVSGEKQVSISQGTEYIRFSGVVNPATINAANAVSSTKVADARIEYKGSGYIDEAQTMGWLARFFQTVSPF